MREEFQNSDWDEEARTIYYAWIRKEIKEEQESSGLLQSEEEIEEPEEKTEGMWYRNSMGYVTEKEAEEES